MAEKFIVEYDFTADNLADIKRCVENLYSTRAGTQPLDREFGIDYEGVIGFPLNTAKNLLALEITEKTEKYEPRVSVKSVESTVDAVSGRLIPTIHLVKGAADDE